VVEGTEPAAQMLTVLRMLPTAASLATAERPNVLVLMGREARKPNAVVIVELWEVDDKQEEVRVELALTHPTPIVPFSMIVEQMVGVGRVVMLVEDPAMETLAVEQNIILEEEGGRELEEAGGKLEGTIMEMEDGKMIQGQVEETLEVTAMMEEEGKLEGTIMEMEDGKLIQGLVEEQFRVLVAALLIVLTMLQCAPNGATVKRLAIMVEEEEVLVLENQRDLVVTPLIVPTLLQCVLSGATVKRLDTFQEEQLGEEMEENVLEEDVFGEGRGGRINKLY